ncbi:MAG: helix-turn-helix domain-containing protein [Cellulomonas sp.]
MSTTPTTLRLVSTAPARSRRREPEHTEQVIAVTLQADDKLLMTVPEAARRLGISRSLFYELISAGQIRTLHIGRLCKVSLQALDDFIAARQLETP